MGYREKMLITLGYKIDMEKAIADGDRNQLETLMERAKEEFDEETALQLERDARRNY